MVYLINAFDVDIGAGYR